MTISFVNKISKKLIEQIKKEFLLADHPIGSLYFSADSTSPELLFGGTWRQIKDTFILTAGDIYKAGDVGGSATHKITIDELPPHDHELNNHTHKYEKSTTITGATTLKIEHIPKHEHNIFSARCSNETSGYGLNQSDVFKDRPMVYADSINSGSTGGGKGHDHSITLNSTNTGEASGNTTTTGGGTEFSILPPYEVKYCWQRTA
jgi:microcystin-dependent protein